MNEYQEKQAGILKKIRDRAREFFNYNNTIDKLLKDKIEDYILIREFPLPISIGEKTIYVGTFTWETQDIFLRDYAKLLGLIAAKHLVPKVGIELLGDGATMYRILQVDRKIKKEIMKLINRTILRRQHFIDPATGLFYRIPKVTFGYFKKYVTYETIVQICMIAYELNYDATRRSLNIIAGELRVQQRAENYCYTWLENLAGLNGNFLIRQLQKSDLWPSELQNQN